MCMVILCLGKYSVQVNLSFKGLRNSVVLCIASSVQLWNVHMECLKVCVSPHCNFMEKGVTLLELGLSH
jgi:hypothetical protein